MPKQDQPRKYLSQTDVPTYPLDQALRVPAAIADNYASKPTRPLAVADAMTMSPNSGPFRALCGSAIAYGLVEGGCNASEISLTLLGKRILRPTKDGDDVAARREALLKPRVIGSFLQTYEGQRLPKQNIGNNVLTEMGVPDDRASKTYEMIVEAAMKEGLIREIKGEKYVDLGAAIAPASSTNTDEEIPLTNDTTTDATEETQPALDVKDIVQDDVRHSFRNRRVYMSHGKNRALVGPIKELLQYGDLEPVVSVERESAAIPVPEKVLNDMRSCGAAIIHVDDEQQLVDTEGKVHVVLNPNVLIEIGAAMALFGKRFIVVLKSGVKLPSNLQGLYYLEYNGETLDVNATVRLLKAVKEMKSIDTPKA